MPECLDCFVCFNKSGSVAELPDRVPPHLQRAIYRGPGGWGGG